MVFMDDINVELEMGWLEVVPIVESAFALNSLIRKKARKRSLSLFTSSIRVFTIE